MSNIHYATRAEKQGKEEELPNKATKKEKEKKMTNVNESGRSMVEMLGVLAIIGVLSIGGIAGYTMAMNRYRANELLDTAAKVAVVAMTKNGGVGASANINELGLSYSSVPCLTNDADITSDAKGKVTIKASGCDQAVADAIKSIGGTGKVSTGCSNTSCVIDFGDSTTTPGNT